METKNGPNIPRGHNLQEEEAGRAPNDGLCSPVRSKDRNRSKLERKPMTRFVRD